jgi:hypothetical protein
MGFDFDARAMDRRLKTGLSLWEGLACSANIIAVTIIFWINPPAFRSDLEIYLRAAHGDLLDYYYANWLLPVFAVLDKLPHVLVYLVWCLLSILAILFAARVFGGRAALALISYQMFYVLYHGQITALLIAALALEWWSLAHRHWDLAGLSLLIASTKFQLGIPMGLSLLALAEISWKERWRVLVLPAGLALLSLAAYPLWPLDLVTRIQTHYPNTGGSLALWRWIGPAALVFWIPPLLLPLSKGKRLAALTAASALGLPYFQQADLLALFVLPLGWLPLAGNLGILQFVFHYPALQALVIIPLGVYLWAMAPQLYRYFLAPQATIRPASVQLDTRPRHPM